MSVRRREWTTATGETKEAWIVDYADQHGNRHIKTFAKKKLADAFCRKASLEVSEGRHTADADSVTVAEAGKRWIRTGHGNRLERATLDDYQRILDMHIVPFLGPVKLSKLSAPTVRDFRDRLGEAGRTPVMVKRIVSALSAILADAHEAGLVAQNVVRSLTNRKKKKSKVEQRRKFKAGKDFPEPAEVKAIVGALQGRWRPLILTALFTGLRASELRGLRWLDVDFGKAEIHVQQRADRYNKIDAPKSGAGDRTVPLPPPVLSALREWKLACPKGGLGLVFPNGAGKVETLGNMISRGLVPAQIAAGVCDIVKDEAGKVVLGRDGNPVRRAKY